MSYKVDWNDWIFENLKCNILCWNRVPGYFIFAVSLWYIWKWRCEELFNEDFLIPQCLGKVIMKFIADWFSANLFAENVVAKKVCLVAWTPPPLGWVKLNVDGS